MSNTIWNSKNKFFIYIIIILFLFSLLAVFFVGLIEYYSFSGDDKEVFQKAISAAEKAFWSSVFLFVPLFFVIRALYLNARRNILFERDSVKQLQEDNRAIKEQLYMDINSNLVCKYILESDFTSSAKTNILVLEIDDYNEIINYYSTEFNRNMLMKIAQEFKEIALKLNFKAYRLSNSKFIMLNYDENLNLQGIKQVAKDLSSFFKGYSISYEGDFTNICVTIGICLYSTNALNKALISLDLAKEKDLDYLVYDENFGIHNRIEYSKERYRLIEEALKEKAVIQAYYQPIFNLNGKICKYEALARIVTKQGAVILPGNFIEYAKHIKRYIDLTKELLEQVFTTIKEHPNILVSINMSISDMLLDTPITKFLLDKLQNDNIGKNLVIEILENENIKERDEHKVKTFIANIRSYGVHIAIDDFGSGFSNFQLILQIVPDYLKIDGSIIKNIDKDTKAQDMVLAIVAFAKRLGIRTTAEFVSSRRIYECCKDLGVDEFQGFYLGEPLKKLID